MFEAVDEGLGRITALINNAGIVDLKARLDEMSVARCERMLDINVIGTLTVFARGDQAHEHAPRRCRGRDRQPVERRGVRSVRLAMYVDYAASKGAIDSLTVGLGRELAGRRRAGQRGQPRHHRHRDPRRQR